MSDFIRILLVEDNPDDADLLKLNLKKNGIEFISETVDTRKAFRKLLENQKWDVVISDYSLPQFTGFEALEIVRNFDPALPFILVSGTIGEDLAVEALHAGASDYVMKNNLKRLSPAIQRSIANYKEHIRRQEAEQSLRSANRKWYNIFQSIGQPAMILDKHFTIVNVNDNTLKLSGKTEAELVGKKCHEIFHGHIPDECPLKKLLETKGYQQLDMEVELLHNEYLISCTPIFDDHGEIDKIIHIATDISDLKKQEREKQELKIQLVQAQKMEAIGRLAGGIAHDFNNLLTVIQGNAQLAKMNTDLGDNIVNYLDQINSASDRASKLTRQLLSFSRKQPLQTSVINLNSVVEGMLKLLHRLIGEDVRIVTQLDSELRNIHGDEGNIEQVIMNLVINARDAMPKGGLITITTDNHTLTETEFKSTEDIPAGDYVSLTIQDTGVGIDQAYLDNIFEPFFSTKDAQGTGLGLSVVYGIVKQHNGFIKVSSQPNTGTVFQFFFPSCYKDVQNEKSGKDEAIVNGNGEMILMVEDDENIRSLFSVALTRYGYNVKTAFSAEEALVELNLENGKYAAVISDIVMPGKSGLELVKDLNKLYPDIKVILTSGYLDEKTRMAEIQKMEIEFVQKPYSIRDLLKSLAKVLNK